MASGVVNIRRDVDDKFYRYRMPILQTKIEGKGNGIKTVIPNMSDVARALSRPPTYTTKFFGCELGAQTSFDEKNDRYIVNGAHNADRLRELLDVFIEKFVLCKSCKNPETELVILKVTRTEDIIRDCKACGERTGVDMRHKLTTFILKNPPVKTKKGKKKAGEENGGTGDNKEEGGDAVDEVNGAESDDELTKRIKAEAAELNKDAALAKEDWSADTSPEAVKARVKALEATMAATVLAGDDEGSDDDVNSPYAQFGRWIEDNKTTEDENNAVQTFKKAQELGIEKKHKTVLVLVQALFTADVVAELETYTPLLCKLVTSEKHQKALLGGIERLVGMAYPELIATVPKILMALYQSDIIEEEVVRQWGTHVSRKYVDKETSKRVRKASEPFLKWLEQADDDEEEEEDEDYLDPEMLTKEFQQIRQRFYDHDRERASVPITEPDRYNDSLATGGDDSFLYQQLNSMSFSADPEPGDGQDKDEAERKYSDDRSMYPQDDKSAGYGIMYELEGRDSKDYDDGTRISRFSASQSIYSVMDDEKSGEARERFLSRVAAMYGEGGREVPPMPPIPKMPEELIIKGTGVGRRRRTVIHE